MISRVDLIILKDLKESENISYVKSKSIYDFKILEAINYNAVYKRILKLEKLGYIEKGLKNGKKNTYFVTNLGIEKLKTVNI